MASVFLGDLDDFLAPSQACVNPLFVSKDTAGQEPTDQDAADSGRAKVTLDSLVAYEDMAVVTETVKPDLIKAAGGDKKATVSLNDCLACSGCVTSAETVLITQQSTHQFLRAIREAHTHTHAHAHAHAHAHPDTDTHTHTRMRAVVVALSPQSLASLSTHLSIPPPHTQRALQVFFRLVVDQELTSVANKSQQDDQHIHVDGDHERQQQQQQQQGEDGMQMSYEPSGGSVSAGEGDLPASGRENGLGVAGHGGVACVREEHVNGDGGGGGGIDVFVYNTAAASAVALMETAAEFVSRFRDAQPRPWSAPPPSRAVSSTHDVSGPVGGEGEPYAAPSPTDAHTSLPLLVSACPGWVCYAEKTTPQAIPYMSTTKSPQQVLGTLVKGVLAPASGLKASEVFLVGVMPCYDKKLEASRKDFVHMEAEGGGWNGAEVDLVLTTGEVLDLIAEKAGGSEKASEWLQGLLPTHLNGHTDGDHMEVEPSDPHRADTQRGQLTLSTAEPLLQCMSDNGAAMVGATSVEGGSGGFVEHVFRAAAAELFGVEVGGELRYVQGRNADTKEVSLDVNGEVVLRMAQAYGFRNIQGVMQKLRRGKYAVHLVEVMACPSGCVNGGGQIRTQEESTAQSKERVSRVSAALHDRQVTLPHQSTLTRRIYSEVAPSGPLSAESLRLFHTRYHTVPKLEDANPSVIKW